MQISIKSNYINDTEVGIAVGVPAKKMDLRVGTRGLFFYRDEAMRDSDRNLSITFMFT